MSTLVLVDETPSGKALSELLLETEQSTMTVRELIEARVRQEVADYHDSGHAVFSGLVQPRGAVTTDRGYALDSARRLDADAQVERALDAFERNGFLLLVGGRQAESLDEALDVTEELRVSFIKLVPLVGG